MHWPRRHQAQRGSRGVSSVIDDEVFDIRHLFHSVTRAFASKTGFLPAAKRHAVNPVDRHVVDHQSTDIPILKRLKGPPQIVGEHPALKTIAGIAGALDCFLECPIAIDGEYRPEHLLVLNLHAFRCIRQYGRLYHRTRSGTAGQKTGAGGHGFVNPALNSDSRSFVDHRTDVDPFLHRVADAAGAHALDEFARKLFRNRFVHEDALDTYAVLSAVYDTTADAARCCKIEIGIFGNDHSAVTSEFQRHLLAARYLLDVPADTRTAGKTDHGEAFITHH